MRRDLAREDAALRAKASFEKLRRLLAICAGATRSFTSGSLRPSSRANVRKFSVSRLRR
jgi:hypothetical protein